MDQKLEPVDHLLNDNMDIAKELDNLVVELLEKIKANPEDVYLQELAKKLAEMKVKVISQNVLAAEIVPSQNQSFNTEYANKTLQNAQRDAMEVNEIISKVTPTPENTYHNYL